MIFQNETLVNTEQRKDRETSGVRLLSRGNVLSRLFELRDEVRLFLMEHGSQLADHLTVCLYLSCIFECLNGLNLSLQGENTSIMSMSDKSVFTL